MDESKLERQKANTIIECADELGGCEDKRCCLGNNQMREAGIPSGLIERET